MRADIDRIVLDTNVCLDLFVFDDPRCTRLRGALLDGDVIAVTDDACRDEWLRVLRYPVLQLDEALRDAATERFDNTMQHRALPHAGAASLTVLPRCRDPDDQKFLELAAAAGARWLLSRDEHLLALARRMKRDGRFGIATPQAWAELYRASAT